MGVHERAEEVLAVTDLYSVTPAWDAHRTYSRVCGRAIHLYVILERNQNGLPGMVMQAGNLHKAEEVRGLVFPKHTVSTFPPGTRQRAAILK
jgi:hypothetical protein